MSWGENHWMSTRWQKRHTHNENMLFWSVFSTYILCRYVCKYLCLFLCHWEILDLVWGNYYCCCCYSLDMLLSGWSEGADHWSLAGGQLKLQLLVWPDLSPSISHPTRGAALLLSRYNEGKLSYFRMEVSLTQRLITNTFTVNAFFFYFVDLYLLLCHL